MVDCSTIEMKENIVSQHVKYYQLLLYLLQPMCCIVRLSWWWLS